MTNLRSAEYAPHLYADMDVPHLHTEHATILAAIERCDAPARLRQWIFNAHKRQAIDVRNAAFRRLARVADKTDDDNLDNAALRVLAIYRTRLTASRCFKVNMSKYQHLLISEGPRALILDMSTRRRFKDISQMLVDFDLAELTLEATIIRFKSKFPKKSVESAKERLLAYGFTGRFLTGLIRRAHKTGGSDA